MRIAAAAVLAFTFSGTRRAAAVEWKAIYSDNRGVSPRAGLTLGSDGNFYGTTFGGGVTDYGTVFKISPDGVLTTLVSFTGVNGRDPRTVLTQGADGSFYGTTPLGGGDSNGPGTVFKVTPAGILTTLAVFNNTNGSNPAASLTAGSDGNFYGTAPNGGASGYGTVFKVTPGGTLTRLSSFAGANGRYPLAGLTPDGAGNFFGTTDSGGTHGFGTVFKVTPGGVLTSVVSFSSTTGRNPRADLVRDSDGSFYGTTASGGTTDFGTVFRVTPGGTLTTLASFTGANGRGPSAGLTPAGNGLFYGTTYSGGGSANGQGTIFKVTTAGELTSLVPLTAATGNYPAGGLVRGPDGNFYGTTSDVYPEHRGTVFKMTPAGVLTTLVSFGYSATGYNPMAGLVRGSDGNYYGTTYFGGPANRGTVFRVTPAGELTTLVFFSGSNGSLPRAALTPGSDGNFYGTTETGGTRGYGTIFRVTPAGSLTTLHSFTGSAGRTPLARLTEGSDGAFYGTTESGGSSNRGTVYKVTPSGQFTSLSTFPLDESMGLSPSGGLIPGTDGNFYGTTSGGGAMGGGTIFKMTPAGDLTTMADFSLFDGNGRGPYGDLMRGSDGNFYGTALSGGAAGGGTVFRMTPGGTLTDLAVFNGTNGSSPRGGLVQGSDGNFYGTTPEGGARGFGTIFRITPAGQLTTLHSFDGAYAARPRGTPVFGPDGNLYGTADNMVVWRFNPATLTPVQSWRMENFGTSAGTGDAADSADPDADGAVNLLELACGTNPKDPQSGPGALQYTGPLTGGGTIASRGQPVIRVDSSAAEPCQLLFLRRRDYTAAGLTYVPAFSPGFTAWQPITTPPRVLAADSLYELVSVPCPSPAADRPAGFARVRVTLTP